MFRDRWRIRASPWLLAAALVAGCDTLAVDIPLIGPPAERTDPAAVARAVHDALAARAPERLEPFLATPRDARELADHERVEGTVLSDADAAARVPALRDALTATADDARAAAAHLDWTRARFAGVANGRRGWRKGKIYWFVDAGGTRYLFKAEGRLLSRGWMLAEAKFKGPYDPERHREDLL